LCIMLVRTKGIVKMTSEDIKHIRANNVTLGKKVYWLDVRDTDYDHPDEYSYYDVPEMVLEEGYVKDVGKNDDVMIITKKFKTVVEYGPVFYTAEEAIRSYAEDLLDKLAELKEHYEKQVELYKLNVEHLERELMRNEQTVIQSPAE